MTLQHEVKSLSSQLALVSKEIAKNATNIEGALHVPARPKRRKPVEPTIFDKVCKYSPDQQRGAAGTPQGGQFVDEGKGTGNGSGGGSHGASTHAASGDKPKGMSRLTQALLIGGGLAVGGALLGPVGRMAAARLARLGRVATPASTAAARGATASTRLAMVHAERDALTEQMAAQRAATIHAASQSNLHQGQNAAANRAYRVARAKLDQMELQHKVLTARAKALEATRRSARRR